LRVVAPLAYPHSQGVFCIIYKYPSNIT
jgi:hypothetical protein